jgi:hypothetical protein
MGEIFDSITLSQAGPETWADVESYADRTLIAAAGGVSLTVVAGTRFEPVAKRVAEILSRCPGSSLA